MLRTIIFDLDGVLIDSESLMRSAFETSYRSVLGDGSPPTEKYLEHMGESFTNIMNRLGLPHTLWQPYREFCQQHLDRIAIFPQSLALLEWARSRGFNLGLLTGKDRLRTLQILDHFGLDSFFHAVVTSDQLMYPKPHPEGIMCILESLSSQPEEAVMIGDAVNDIVAAQQANVRAIAVTWGIRPDLVLSLCQPDFVVHDWESLLRVLDELSTDAIGKEE
jgi:3-amino-5-hydroxybenzoic acid synthesis related protein